MNDRTPGASRIARKKKNINALKKEKKEMKKNYKTPPAESTGQAPRSYVQMLEEKIIRYERILQRCPRFLAEQSAASAPDIEWTEPYHDEEFDDELYDEFDDEFDDEFEDDELYDDFDDELYDEYDDADLCDTDVETGSLKSSPSGGAYSEAVLQAFPHIRTFQRLVGRRR